VKRDEEHMDEGGSICAYERILYQLST
jgi:hypothetical protein